MAYKKEEDAIEIPFLGGAYEGRSKSINAQQSINLFPVFDHQEPKSVIAMYGTPGLTEFSAPATTAGVRGMHVMGSYLYAVVGAVVYQINTAGVASSLGSITTSTGHVGMADNGTQLLIVDGTAYGHIVTTGSLTDIPTASNDFPSSDDCIFFDGYFIVTVTGTGKIQISDLYDGLVWDALDFATAESAADDLIGIGATKQHAWLIGALTTEVYYNSGNTDFPFERMPGAVMKIGCAALSSITEINGDVYWLSHKKQVVKSQGYVAEPVSTSGIDAQIASYATISDADGWTYTLEGRTFFVLAFPTADKTWVLDVDTKQWHEWQSLDGSDDPEMYKCVSAPLNGQSFNGSILAGDRATGQVFTLDLDVYTDDGTDITRVRRTQIINKKRLQVLHHQIEIEFEPGPGLDVIASADGYNPQAVLKWSDDGGNSWSAGRSVDIGMYQSYDDRAIWRQLGKSRNRIYELTITEPVKIVLVGADARLTACKA